MSDKLKIPDDLTQYYDDAKRRAAGRLSLEVQLIERIAKSEDREAELKAEIERAFDRGVDAAVAVAGQLEDEAGARGFVLSEDALNEIRAIKGIASAKRHDDRMEALERSHKGLLKAAISLGSDASTLRGENSRLR